MAEASKSYADLVRLATSSGKEYDLALIEKGYKFAFDAHKDQVRQSGEPYIIHPIAVACKLIEFGMDTPSVVAGLLHDVIEDTAYTYDDIAKNFGKEIANLTEGVTKLGKIPFSSREEQQAENLRKMLMAMSEDIRVIIIKFADRMHNLSTLEYVSPQKQRDKALECLEVYAPIAHRLGMRTVKEYMEDVSLKYLDPVAYHEIEENLEARSTRRKQFVESTKELIRSRVEPLIPGVYIEGRVKSINGIHRKMFIQGKSFDEIYDVFALRVIVNTIIDCYNVLGIVHDMFTPLPNRFKDYISTPKQNMYQSLHTTVISKEGIPFEVQIRTWEMHHTAEYGIAAHWKYKLGMTSGNEKPDSLEARLQWIRNMLDNQSESEDVTDLVRSIKTDLAPEEVFVFTPTGEIIEILTTKEVGRGPNRDWLSLVRTSEARNKIRTWFKKEKREENIVEGKAELEREFKRNNIVMSDELMQFMLDSAGRRHSCSTPDDFYAAIGYGGIQLWKIMPRVKEEYQKYQKPADKQADIQQQAPQTANKKAAGGVLVEGMDNCLIKFSRCCNPLPGDEIIGFITRGFGVSIHKRSCSNVPKDFTTCPEPERWVRAHWAGDVKEEFKSTLHIVSTDRSGLLADVTQQLFNMHIFIHSLNSREIKNTENALISATISINGMAHLQQVIDRLSKIRGVISIDRS